MKLVLHDPAWPIYEPALRQLLGNDWTISVGSNDLQWLIRELPDADALIAIDLPSQALPAAENLKLFLYPGAGFVQQHSDELPAGCALSNVYEHEVPISEYVMMVILMFLTRVRHFEQTFRAGHWNGTGRVGGEPHEEAQGKTVGLIGYGHIGQAIAKRAASFGMRVQAIRQRTHLSASPDFTPGYLGGPENLEQLLATSHFVVIACPLTARTRGWIGARELNVMLRDGVLINVARAEIVQEKALFEALKSNRIRGAALDVWYQNPKTLTQTIHGSQYEFHLLPNVLVTPHLSGWTGPMIQRRMRKMADNLKRLEQGMELERVVMVGSWRR
jgi:phosphoglycerate dehydrogenase-like enzyme